MDNKAHLRNLKNGYWYMYATENKKNSEMKSVGILVTLIILLKENAKKQSIVFGKVMM